MVCPAGGSCCSLQERLHQLEAARASEMEAHGLRIRELQGEADASAASLKELQLELAKRRADTFRLEAEVANARRKTQLVQETLELERAAAAKELLEMKKACQEKEQCAVRVREELNASQRERQRLAEEGSDLRAVVDALRLENQSIRATSEERMQTIHAQATENGRLDAARSSKEQELVALKLRHELLEKELVSVRDALAGQRERCCRVGREVERALQTRNRAITWRRGWIDSYQRELVRRELFVAWKSQLLDAIRCRNGETAAANDAVRLKLRNIGSVLHSQCIAVRDDLNLGRALWQQQGAELEALRHQTVSDAFPRVFELAMRIQDRCEMAASDVLSGSAAVRDTYATKKQRARNRENALVKLLERQRSGYWRTRAFNRWKDWYLRNVVGETTHAAMIARGAQDEGEPQELARRKLSVAVAALRTGRSEDDESWQRWRRVASSGAALRKSRMLLQLPMPSPSRGPRCTTGEKSSERASA